MQQPLIFLIFIFLSFACGNRSIGSETDSGSTVVPSFKGDAGDACFDRQLQVWLEKFQHHQQTGSDMFEADAKARAEALDAYLDCNNRVGNEGVRDAARKE